LIPRPSEAQIFSSAPYSQTPSAYLPPLNVSDQVSHPYKTKEKIMVLVNVIFIFLDSKLEEKTFSTEGLQSALLSF
jgi:hypothetical protein